MGKLILITGGARSGKSTHAESLAASFEKTPGTGILYAATCTVSDEEMADRVVRHKARRPSGWQTLEASENVGARILEAASIQPPPEAVLLDCITLLVSQCMVRELKDWDTISPEDADRVEASVREEVEGLMAAADQLSCPLIAVTNEAGMGLVPDYASGRLFRDAAGRANQLLAAHAEEVILCVSGIPVRIKPFGGNPA